MRKVLLVGLAVFFGVLGVMSKELVFYYVPHTGAGDPFWAVQKLGWETACKQLGVKGIFTAPVVFSVQEQVNMLESAIAARPDGIAVTISSDTAFDAPLKKAKELGIPVIAVNIEDYAPPYVPYLAYIGQDEFIVGETLANRVLKEFTPKRAVIGIHQPGLTCLELRAEGIIRTFAEKGIPIEKIDITPYPTQALEILKAYLKKYPDTDMIFTLGPLGAHPAIDLIIEQGLVGKVRLATCDVSDKILDAIKNDVMICAIAQQPFMQGYLAAVWLYLHVQYGFLPPAKMPTGPTVIDKTNLPIAEKQVQTTGGL
ncbi:MAG: sugar ABC transporter substrate-binding protein [Methanomassiliicoccales archaeon]|nr:sugar ABC transporter substrate-binding protein [Methanomassiliicoccales archaeon]